MRTVRLLTVILRQARPGAWPAVLQCLDTRTTLFRSDTARKEKTLLQRLGGSTSTPRAGPELSVKVTMS